MKKFLLTIGMGALLFAMGPGSGQGMGKGLHKFSGAQNFLDRFDTDKDGRVSRKEWEERRAVRMQQRAKEGRPMKNAGRMSFDDIDTNHDGYIDLDEIKAFRQQRQQRSMQ